MWIGVRGVSGEGGDVGHTRRGLHTGGNGDDSPRNEVDGRDQENAATVVARRSAKTLWINSGNGALWLGFQAQCICSPLELKI